MKDHVLFLAQVTENLNLPTSFILPVKLHTERRKGATGATHGCQHLPHANWN